MVVHILNLSTWEVDAGGSLSLRPEQQRTPILKSQNK